MNRLTKRREPLTYMLYLAIFGSSLLFVFIFFVFLKKEYLNQDVPVLMPKIFWLSTFVILLSSSALHLSSKYLNLQNFTAYRYALTITFVTGLLFFVFQFWGWKILSERNITMANNTGGAFIYIFSALHLVHALGGLVALSYTLAKSFKNRTYVDSFVFSVNPPNVLRLKMVSIYWHFLTVLWILIFLFMVYHAT